MRAPRVELYQDPSRDWRWRFRHVNGRIMADSAEGYRRKQAARHGARVVCGESVPIVEV